MKKDTLLVISKGKIIRINNPITRRWYIALKQGDNK